MTIGENFVHQNIILSEQKGVFIKKTPFFELVPVMVFFVMITSKSSS